MSGNTETAAARILLLPGTWASLGEWKSPSFPLRRHLTEALDGKAQFAVFPWNGANSHPSRLRAARRLARFLERDEGPPLWIVAHSHGGNVALRSFVESPGVASKVAGIAFIATPFLTIRRRVSATWMAFWLAGAARWTVCLSLFALALLLAILTAMAGSDADWASYLLMEVTITFVGVLFFLAAFAASRLFWKRTESWPGKVDAWVDRLQRRYEAAHRCPFPPPVPWMIQRTQGDEAGVALGITVGIDILSRLAIPFLVARTFWKLQLQSGNGAAGFLWLGVVVVAPCVWLGGMLTSLLTFLGPGLPWNLSTLLAFDVFRAPAEPGERGLIRSYELPKRRSTFLRHSEIYRRQEIVAELAGWIASGGTPPAKTEPPT